ncbi:MAG: heme-binding protein [Gammaproteobacteria bacterium]|nr:heme-binding protein [Gammaproteobacteria bacterium]MDE0442910.1 heme-binding protein [Gammaproteobacteria bacterium]
MNDRVAIAEVPGGLFAVLRYRGHMTEARFLKHAELLRATLQRDGLETVGEPVSAVYNGPWTQPFMRGNEVMIRLRSGDPASD